MSWAVGSTAARLLPQAAPVFLTIFCYLRFKFFEKPLQLQRPASTGVTPGIACPDFYREAYGGLWANQHACPPEHSVGGNGRLGACSAASGNPYLQRFLSPDNYVQSPFNAQNYNRYSYCLNNPLMYTDPSGYTWLSHFTGWVGENWKPIVATIVATAAIIVTQAYIPAIIGGYMNLAMNGKNINSFGDMIGTLAVGAAAGAIGAGIASGINSALVPGVQGTFMRGFTGVATKFSTGFFSGFVSGAKSVGRVDS